MLLIPALEEVYAAGNKIAAIEAVKSFWETGGFFISVLILITTLGCTNATILASCRTYFAMVR
ncbi:hypothetical protein [Rufibacter tibetensis]|uniref:hypothetical protein n=1 Tax=Rufibacter tibetensis TaxID=512763 RepID=UPI000AA53B89|nr:hypothetical protein [Rufibacter tibetensis]